MSEREMLQRVTKALGDLSFECFGGIGTTRPSLETYNRTFGVLEDARAALAAPAAPLVGEPATQGNDDGQWKPLTERWGVLPPPPQTADAPCGHMERGVRKSHCARCMRAAYPSLPFAEAQRAFIASASPAAPAGVPTDLPMKMMPLVQAIRSTAWAGGKAYQRNDDAEAGRCIEQSDEQVEKVRALLAANSFHPPACDSSEASGSAIPARPTLPEDERRAFERRMLDFGWRNFDGRVAGEPRCWYYDNSDLNARWLGWRERALLAGGDQKAAPLHPSSVQAVDGDEPTPYKTLYYELLYAVGQKFPGETRHQTALRYIHERETASSASSGAAMKDKSHDN